MLMKQEKNQIISNMSYKLLIKNVLWDEIEFLDEQSLNKAIELLKKDNPQDVVGYFDACSELTTIPFQPSWSTLQPETKDGIVLVEAYADNCQIWKSF